jgi:Zn-dependent protease
MFSLAAPTPYDLRFHLLGVRVRINPWFWLVMAIISGQNNHLPGVLIFIGCAFVSILVHEFGHGLTSASFGYHPSEIVLYGMGGYCACEIERQTPGQRLAVLAMGPGAGFLLLLIVCIVGVLAFNIPFADDLTIMLRMIGIPTPGRELSLAFDRLTGPARTIYLTLFWINLMWGLLNLLPVWPLDGGRLCEVLLSMYNRRHGTRWAHIVSLLTAAVVAMYFLRSRDLFGGIMFASLAFMNYQVLQALHQASRYSDAYDDADWWKR